MAHYRTLHNSRNGFIGREKQPLTLTRSTRLVNKDEIQLSAFPSIPDLTTAVDDMVIPCFIKSMSKIKSYDVIWVLKI